MLHRVVDALRSGSWLDRARLRRLGILLAIAYVASWVYLLSGPGRLDPLGRPLGVDFAMFYGVSRALLHGVPAASLYAPEALYEAIREWTAGDRYLLLYPPTALLLYAPLAAMPYLAALGVWTGAGLLAYLAAIRRVSRGRALLVPALLFPAVYVCISNGHNGLLNAGLLGAALVALPASPVAAGALFGAVAALKPHLALLVPVALVSARRWRALAAMFTTVVAMAAVATIIFGGEVWAAFLGSAQISRLVVEREAVSYATLASVFSATRLLGAPITLGYVAQGVAALAAAGVVAWSWKDRRAYELQAATLLLSGALATPYVYDYDLPAIGVGLAFWATTIAVDGWRPWEKTAVFATWLVPLLTRPVAMAARLGLLPLVLVLALTVVSRRAPEAALARARAAP